MSNINCSIHRGVLIIEFSISSFQNTEDINATGAQLLAMTYQAPNSSILLDFTGVRFMNSSMVGQLFLLHKRCRHQEIVLRMRNLEPVIRDVLKIVGLTQLVEIIVDDDDLVGAFEEWDSTCGISETVEIVSVAQLKLRAIGGDVRAMVDYGLSLEDGRDGEQNIEQGFHWYRVAAEAGNADGQYKTGMANAYGIGVESNWNEAMRWYRKAAEQGHAEAEYAVGMIQRYGLAGAPDPTEAIEWYRKSLAHGYEKARVELEHLGINEDE